MLARAEVRHHGWSELCSPLLVLTLSVLVARLQTLLHHQCPSPKVLLSVLPSHFCGQFPCLCLLEPSPSFRPLTVHAPHQGACSVLVPNDFLSILRICCALGSLALTPALRCQIGEATRPRSHTGHMLGLGFDPGAPASPNIQLTRPHSSPGSLRYHLIQSHLALALTAV